MGPQWLNFISFNEDSEIIRIIFFLTISSLVSPLGEGWIVFYYTSLISDSVFHLMMSFPPVTGLLDWVLPHTFLSFIGTIISAFQVHKKKNAHEGFPKDS